MSGKILPVRFEDSVQDELVDVTSPEPSLANTNEIETDQFGKVVTDLAIAHADLGCELLLGRPAVTLVSRVADQSRVAKLGAWRETGEPKEHIRNVNSIE